MAGTANTHGYLQGALLKSISHLRESLEDGGVWVGGESEVGHCFKHLQGGILLRHDVVHCLRQHQALELVEEILTPPTSQPEVDQTDKEEEKKKESCQQTDS